MSWNGTPVIDLDSHIVERADRCSPCRRPSDDIVERIVEVIDVTSGEEIVRGLHVLWPLTRHVSHDEVVSDVTA
ncbi:MAG TPA: hypothetical protein VMC04_03960 [Verrucomicrobiae bacterium]|jgi:hypothetical protein|nr:hypothetical protein [Verrucomicrobiae bacterium]